MKPTVAAEEEGAVLVADVQLEALTNKEKKHLHELEATITAGLRNFMDTGSALAEIRDLRLYRETHSSFENYCAEKWGMRRSNANRLIATSSIAADLDPKPISEAAMRPLIALTPARRLKVWDKAVDKAGSVEQVTESLVKQLVGGRRVEVSASGQSVKKDDLIEKLETWYESNSADLNKLSVAEFFSKMRAKIRRL